MRKWRRIVKVLDLKWPIRGTEIENKKRRVCFRAIAALRGNAAIRSLSERSGISARRA
jgi:hypothetical protein